MQWTQLLGRVAFVTILCGGSMSNAYTWPNPLLEELDSQLYDRKGYNLRGLPGGMEPDCTRFIDGSSAGRANVADWVRTVSAHILLQAGTIH